MTVAPHPEPETPPAKRRRLYLIDGSGYIFRAFHALPMMTRPDGTPVNAVYGFCNMLQKLLDDVGLDDSVAVIFDASGISFRNDIYDDYKAHRPDPPEELVPQFPMFREATRAFNLPCVEQLGYEADDLIATYAEHAVADGQDVVIVSSDKDLMQVIQPGVTMLDPMKNNAVIGPAEVEKRFGVGPEKVVDVQALAGDSVDNVPGVPGIGVKTAALLINEFGDLDSVLANASSIKQPKRRENLIEFADSARISLELVTLKTDVAVEAEISAFGRRDVDPEVLAAYLAEQNFKSLLERLRTRWFRDGLTDDDPQAVAAPPVNATYELVTDNTALDGWLAAAEASGQLVLEVATTVPGDHNMRATIAGVGLAAAHGKVAYVVSGHLPTARQGDLGFGQRPGADQVALADLLGRLRPLLEDTAIVKIGHNIKRDLLVLAHGYQRLGQQPPVVEAIDDVMLLSFVVDGGRNSHDLAGLAERHLERTLAPVKDLVGTGKSAIAFAETTPEDALGYIAPRVECALQLREVLRKRLVREHMVGVYETLERPLVGVLAKMERTGILVDREMLVGLSADFAQRMEGFVGTAHALAGEEFNIGSPKQLGEILFGKLGMSGGKKGKTGAYSTGADILDELAAAGHELPRVVLDWRQLSKLKSTYTDSLVEQINPETDRVHTDYAQAVAQTGRLSSNDPNLQNIPVRTDEGRKIRGAFIAAPGHKLVSLDYSQIELRIVADVARIEPMIEAFRDGQDIHAITASQVFGVPIDGMDGQTRRRAKAINFGIIYGISAFGLARNLGIARGEAKDYIDAYFERYPGIRAYMDTTVAAAREAGHVTTLFGRRIHLTGIHDKNPMHRNFAERQAINAPIQGSAADIIKRAMIRVPPALNAVGLTARMLLQVHDELLFEVPEAEVEQTVDVVRGVMEGAALPVVSLAVPLVADTGVGDTWEQAH